MPAPSRNIPVHPALLATVAIALVLLSIQGLRVASQRQEQMLPARAVLTKADASPQTVRVSSDTERFIVMEFVSPAPELLGLVQIFPERQVLRWVETPPHGGESLVVPLRGLQAGDYEIVELAKGTKAGPREMDRPEDEQKTLLHLELR